MKQKEYSIPKPLCYFAIALIVSSILGLGLLYSVFNDISFDSDFSLFIIAMIMFHSIVGCGILSKKRWGFIIFKIYLYLLYLAVPIGTYIAYKTLNYIEHHQLAKIYR